MQGISLKFCYCVTYVKQIWLVFFYTWEFMNDLVYRLNFEYGHSKDSLFLVYNTTGDIYIFINCILILCVLSSFMSICYIKADVVLYTPLLINFCYFFFYQLFVSCILVILFQMFLRPSMRFIVFQEATVFFCCVFISFFPLIFLFFFSIYICQ